MTASHPGGTALTAMQAMLTTHGLDAAPAGDGALTVTVQGGAPVTVTVTDGDSPRWTARTEQVTVYDARELSIPSDIDAVWAAEATARYRAEREQGTDLTSRPGGSLSRILARAFQAHGIPTAEDPGSTAASSALVATFPDGNEMVVWDAAHETDAIPASDYIRLGAWLRHGGYSDDADVPQEEIDLQLTGTLWGDIAVLLHIADELHRAAVDGGAVQEGGA
ncbi:hypothetical protein ACFYMW_35700 [Streptomyces sp. NPDC006692]|uniref:hypothetical protein n=1 Tax=unclassified Streptomyces TaxID=2593676 RepID=UPI00343D297E